MKQVRLARNLRRQILRGHPWIYQNALKSFNAEDGAQLCQLQDHRGDHLGYGMLDGKSPLAIRMLSTDKRPLPEGWVVQRFEEARSLRKSLPANTNAYRLFNGEGDRLPGLVCDIYDDVAVVQFDGAGPSEFWSIEQVSNWLKQSVKVKTIYDKSRMLDSARRVVGEERPTVEIIENGVKFEVAVVEGQKTGFFLDQRDNREYLSQFAAGQTLLNLFSYTGGFSVYAGVRGAKEVTSVDIAPRAIEWCEINWRLNNVNSPHIGVASDVSSYLKEVGSKKWNLIAVDPPSMASSEKNKPQAIKKYVEIFSEAAKRVEAGGHLFLSSCSSHINFEDFYAIGVDALSNARKTGQVLRYSGQGLDHPFPHICPELRYLKFLHFKL